MFEARFQTHWADVDAAGIVYYPHFFRFVEHAEEELFRAAGRERQPLIEESGIWMPRVEAFSKFSKLAAGYVTVVCVDAIRFKATPIPDAIRTIIQNA